MPTYYYEKFLGDEYAYTTTYIPTSELLLLPVWVFCLLHLMMILLDRHVSVANAISTTNDAVKA